MIGRTLRSSANCIYRVQLVPMQEELCRRLNTMTLSMLLQLSHGELCCQVYGCNFFVNVLFESMICMISLPMTVTEHSSIVCANVASETYSFMMTQLEMVHWNCMLCFWWTQFTTLWAKCTHVCLVKDNMLTYSAMYLNACIVNFVYYSKCSILYDHTSCASWWLVAGHD